MKNVGLFENLFGTNPEYTVRNKKTKEEVTVRDAKELEKLAAREQGKDPNKPDDFWQRIFSR